MHINGKGKTPLKGSVEARIQYFYSLLSGLADDEEDDTLMHDVTDIFVLFKHTFEEIIHREEINDCTASLE